MIVVKHNECVYEANEGDHTEGEHKLEGVPVELEGQWPGVQNRPHQLPFAGEETLNTRCFRIYSLRSEE